MKCAFLMLLASVASLGAESTLHESASVREARRIGFQIVHMGAPYLQMLGVSVGVNLIEKIRGRLIYAPGLVTQPNEPSQTLHTAVVAVDGFLFDQALSPMLSLQTAFTRGAESFSDAFGRNARHLLLSAGADFVRRDGLNAGVSVNLPINEPVSGIHFYLGWFSNLI